MLNHQKTVRLLKKYNIPYVNTVVGKRRDVLHNKLKFPVVLKAISDEIVHKTDAGGVIIGIRNRTELALKIMELQKLVHKKYPGLDMDFMVQEQINGHEILIGMKRDAQFGPVIAFGLGGVFVELFKDVSLKIAPLSNHDINEMINEIKASKLLKGYRGGKPVNMSALKSLLGKISKMSVKEKDIAEIDFNPVMVNEKTAVVVDARLIR